MIVFKKNILIFITFVFLYTGCSSDCAKLRAECDTHIQTQSYFENSIPKDKIHFATLIRDDFLEKVANISLQPMLEKGLKVKTNIPISGSKKIAISATPEIKDLAISADAACDQCIRISGTLGGKATINLPFLGTRNVPLSGNIALVAPLSFSPSTHNKTSVKVDLAKTAEYNPRFINASLKQIPSTWARVLTRSFSKALSKALLSSMKPLTLFEFETPDFGVKNLQLSPVKLLTDSKNHTLAIGFASNLKTSKAHSTIGDFPTLAKGSNFALGFDPEILSNLTLALTAADKIPQKYNKQGKADTKGPITITINRFRFSSGKGKIPFTIGFRYWQLPQDGQCLWADVDAVGELNSIDGNIQTKLSNFDLQRSSLPKILVDFAQWTRSGFSKNQSRIFTKALTKSPIQLPGNQSISLRSNHLEFENAALWIHTTAIVKKK